MTIAKRPKPGIAKKPATRTARVKKVRPLSPSEFHDLLEGVKRERSYWNKAVLWLGAKFISAGLFCYRLTD